MLKQRFQRIEQHLDGWVYLANPDAIKKYPFTPNAKRDIVFRIGAIGYDHHMRHEPSQPAILAVVIPMALIVGVAADKVSTS